MFIRTNVSIKPKTVEQQKTEPAPIKKEKVQSPKKEKKVYNIIDTPKEEQEIFNEILESVEEENQMGEV